MKRDDHILLLTRALLTASDDAFTNRMTIISGMYTTDQNKKPGVVSIGAVTDRGEETLAAWAKRLVDERVNTVRFFYGNESDKLPAHIAAAFAGPSTLLMQVSINQRVLTYALATFMSPQHEITPGQFVTLFDAQENPTRAWERAAELVVESNRLNGRADVDAISLREYLLTKEGSDVLEFLGSNILEEVQIDFEINKEKFTIPEQLSLLFTKYESSPFFDTQDKGYVYLYPLREVTADELVGLIAAQSFSGFWQALNAKIIEWDIAVEEKQLTPEEWVAAIKSMGPGKLQEVTNAACRTICEICEGQKIKPVIPEELATAFGPNEEDQRRAAVRSKGSSSRWVLQGTSAPWELYLFNELDDFPAQIGVSAVSQEGTLISALQKIESFASRNHSVFAEAFGLALFILTKLPSGSFDSHHADIARAQLKEDGFSERAITVFDDNFPNGAFFLEIGYDERAVRGLLAVSIADVFGGMGSWNDQYFEHDAEEFEQVSAGLFDAMRNYFAAVLGFPSN